MIYNYDKALPKIKECETLEDFILNNYTGKTLIEAAGRSFIEKYMNSSYHMAYETHEEIYMRFEDEIEGILDYDQLEDFQAGATDDVMDSPELKVVFALDYFEKELFNQHEKVITKSQKLTIAQAISSRGRE